MCLIEQGITAISLFYCKMIVSLFDVYFNKSIRCGAEMCYSISSPDFSATFFKAVKWSRNSDGGLASYRNVYFQFPKFTFMANYV